MSDLIDRQEAIDALTDYWHGIEIRHQTLDGEMAVYCDCKNIIKNLPSAQPTQPNAPNTLDVISREEAIDAVYERIKQIGFEDNVDVLSIRQAVREVPSIQPELLSAYKEKLWFVSAQQELPKELLACMKNTQIATIPAEEPKVKGKWIGGELGECSICGHEGCASDIWTGCEKTYCPNCGNELEGIRI